ncbi:MAG: chorismate synthase [Planctomycetia bacterium]|nr:chorismate synthase [Planctomycetia bacterium]
MLTYHTAGESHGKGLLALVDGFPAGLEIDTDVLDRELRRRQGGYGRGGRQALETDTVEILTGVQGFQTLGSPIALWVKNRDYRLPGLGDLESPRPGHGDLSGSQKYQTTMRAILERASARETAARVAAGGLARQLLSLLGIEVFGYVQSVGPVRLPLTPNAMELFALMDVGVETAAEKLRATRAQSELYALCSEADEQAGKEAVDAAGRDGDTLGGVIEIRATGLPFGLGTHAQWDAKLDGLLAQAVMAVQAIKGVEIGMGFHAAELPGSQVQDPIRYSRADAETRTRGFVRPTNNAGGLEAGMTNTQPLVLRAAMKPIATLRKPLESVHLKTHEPVCAAWERSDICAISAASVVVENVVAFTLAQAVVAKFGGDSVTEILERYHSS